MPATRMKTRPLCLHRAEDPVSLMPNLPGKGQ